MGVPADVLVEAKKLGYSDAQLAVMLETSEEQVATRRNVLGIKTDAGSVGGACYLSYEPAKGCPELQGRKIIVLGGGPNRIGQGSEFDYCVTQAVEALAGEGYTPIVVNCNPDAVSTSGANPGGLYIAPLTLEDVTDVIEREKPEGVVIGFGGQTALSLGRSLGKSGVPSPWHAGQEHRSDHEPQVVTSIFSRSSTCARWRTRRPSSIPDALEKARQAGLSRAGQARQASLWPRQDYHIRRRGYGGILRTRAAILTRRNNRDLQVPGRCHRSDRGRRGRWRERDCLRGDGAHRAGGSQRGRQRVFPTAAQPGRGCGHRDQTADSLVGL